ncbi:hypothetical protein Tco_1238687 [Tanacetum coccineum]
MSQLPNDRVALDEYMVVCFFCDSSFLIDFLAAGITVLVSVDGVVEVVGLRACGMGCSAVGGVLEAVGLRGCDVGYSNVTIVVVDVICRLDVSAWTGGGRARVGCTSVAMCTLDGSVVTGRGKVGTRFGKTLSRMKSGLLAVTIVSK